MPLPSSPYGIYGPPLGSIFDTAVGGSAVTADAAVVERFEDSTGNGHHLTKTTANRLIYDAVNDLLVSQEGAHGWMNLPDDFTFDRQAFSIFLVIDLCTLRDSSVSQTFKSFFQSAGNAVDGGHYGEQGFLTPFIFDGSFTVTSPTINPKGLALVGMTLGTGAAKIWINTASASIAALSAGTVSGAGSSILGHVDGWRMSAGIKKIYIYQRDVSANVADIFADAQLLGVTTNQTVNAVFEGDSITSGYGSTCNRGYTRQMTRTDVRRINFGQGSNQLVTATTGMLATAVSMFDTLYDATSGVTNVASLFAGTNDIALGGRTAAQVSADTDTWIDGRRSAGFITVEWGMLPRGAGNETARQALRTLRLARYTTSTAKTNVWSDGTGYYIDMGADTDMGQAGQNTGSFYDAGQIHPNESGYAILAGYADDVFDLIAPVGPDTTPPLENSFTIGDPGTTWAMVMSEKCTGVAEAIAGSDFRLSTGQTLSGGTTADGGITWTGTCELVYKAQSPTLRYLDGDGFVSDTPAGNLLMGFTGATVTNNSTVICAVPSNLRVTPLDSKLRISWDANTEPVLASYKLYHSTTVNGTYTLLQTITAPTTTYTHTGLTNGDSGHFYKVSSVDSGGNESAKSSAVQGTPAVPARRNRDGSMRATTTIRI